MTLREWRVAHQRWIRIGSLAGVMVAVILGDVVSQNFWVQFLVVLVVLVISVAVVRVVPIASWFFAPDGRKAQR